MPDSVTPVEVIKPKLYKAVHKGRFVTDAISSIRSWMLSVLVWTDAQSVESRDLILVHLSPQGERDPDVRVLAQCGHPVDQAEHHGPPDRVEFLRAVQRDRGDAVGQVKGQALCILHAPVVPQDGGPG